MYVCILYIYTTKSAHVYIRKAVGFVNGIRAAKLNTFRNLTKKIEFKAIPDPVMYKLCNKLREINTHAYKYRVVFQAKEFSIIKLFRVQFLFFFFLLYFSLFYYVLRNKRIN